MPRSSRTSSRWNSLIALCAALPDILDLSQLLDLAVHKTAEFFDARFCAVFLKENGLFRPAAWAGPVSQPLEEIAFESDRDLRRYVERVVPADRGLRVMNAPLISGGERVGELVIASALDGRRYTSLDRQMLELLAHRLVFAVRDARFLEKARVERQALARIAAALAGDVELQKVAETAVGLAISELGADGAGVWKVGTEERTLRLLEMSGFGPELPREYDRLSFDAPTMASRAAATGEIQIAESLEQLPDSAVTTRRVFQAAGMQSVVAVPLLARGKLVGVLGFACKTPHRWASDELVLIKTLADLLASAICNALLYEESQRRRLLAEAIIENSPVAIAVMAGPEHRYVLVNAARERIFGLPREKQIGRTPPELSPGLAGSPVLELIDRVYRTGENATIPEYHFEFGPPVGARDLSLLYAPLKGPSGQIEGVVSLMVDITDQVAARRKLEELSAGQKAANEQLVQANLRSTEMTELAQQRAAELEAIIANIADAVFVCDPRGKILLINNAGLQMIGVERISDLHTLADYLRAARVRFLNGSPVPEEELAISRALRGEVVRGMEEIIYDASAGRDRYILVSAAPVRDAKGNPLGAVEVHSDITRLKELDLLKDQFITVAAHEIKTPVTAIKGFAQALLRTPDACAPKYHRPLETIVQQSDRIDSLVRDFLEMSRVRWGRTEVTLSRIDLTALVVEVVDRMAAASRKHRLLVSRKDAAWVEGDRERLEEVMVNLLDNAIKFSPQGGDVEVRVVREGDRVVVSVTDHGVGIPRDRQSHIFDRFYRAHIGTPFDYGGLGVGLYMSREIVHRHGGEMWFESEEGRGSTFYFSLPIAEDQS